MGAVFGILFGIIIGMRDLEPATAANDWWPASEDWTTYTVHFTNGFQKTFRSLEEIKIIE